MQRDLRMYEPAWLELKKSVDSPKRIVISAPKPWHRRIYKAIIKEKDMDVVYKLMLSENWQTARLTKKSEHGKLTIYLHLSIGKDEL